MSRNKFPPASLCHVLPRAPSSTIASSLTQRSSLWHNLLLWWDDFPLFPRFRQCPALVSQRQRPCCSRFSRSSSIYRLLVFGVFLYRRSNVSALTLELISIATSFFPSQSPLQCFSLPSFVILRENFLRKVFARKSIPSL